MEDEKSLVEEFLKGGWLIPLVGAGSMLARLLSSDGEYTIKQHIKKILTASIASVVAWFILEQTDISSLHKAITYGIIGVISPELITGIVKLGTKFAANPEKFLSKK